jgi:hypothetical protein
MPSVAKRNEKDKLFGSIWIYWLEATSSKKMYLTVLAVRTHLVYERKNHT